MPSPIRAFARCVRALNKGSRDSGQSLIETALAVPFLLLIALNAINFAYYFFVAINLAAAPRNAVEYSVQGFATPSQPASLPSPGPACSSTVRGNTSDLAVSSLAYYDIIAVLPNTGGGNPCPGIAAVQVCSSKNGPLNNAGTATATTVCTAYGPSASPAFASPASDPESPNFVLDRVDIQYTVNPLIGGTLPVFGGIRLNVLPSYTFHRQVSMREMN
ncbi:MAG TPA: TadE family protein [Terriglobia bacterium]|nr:TadE family protein [Terriglobia bacterium]